MVIPVVLALLLLGLTGQTWAQSPNTASVVVVVVDQTGAVAPESCWF